MSIGSGIRQRNASAWRVTMGRWLRSAGLHLLVVIAAVTIGFPFFYMVSTSLKTVSEVYSIPMVLLPAQPQWGNFVKVWNLLPFGRFTLNSVIYAVSITLGEFTMGVMAGFAFARLRFPKKEII